MFYDEAKIWVQAGRGGNGAVAFRREKFVPRGGPAGGDGGDGGDVVLRVDPQLNTLVHFQRQSHFRAGSGTHGRGKDQTGARGEDVVIRVPPGTVVRDATSSTTLADLVAPGQSVVVAHGGRGGRGNARFATASHQAPRLAEKGASGEERWLYLELRLLADVGLIGIPNAGKSTLLAAVSAARPKIAEYPFTTLEPNLGVVTVDDEQSFVLADLPGLIEGAHAGAGLGHEFLRHIQRTRLLIHVLDGADPEVLARFDQINHELELFSPALAERPQLVAFNKMDLPDAQVHWPPVQAALRARQLTAHAISAATGQGVSGLMRQAARLVRELPQPELEPEAVPVFRIEQAPEFSIEREPQGWRVQGAHVEELVERTMWEYQDAVERVQRQLEAMGVLTALRQAGVQPGDSVRIGAMELEWIW